MTWGPALCPVPGDDTEAGKRHFDDLEQFPRLPSRMALMGPRDVTGAVKRTLDGLGANTAQIS